MTQSASEAVVSGPEDLVQASDGSDGGGQSQGQTRDIEETLSLQAVDEKGEVVEGVTLNPDRVRVKVTIVAQVDVQQISVVPDVQGQPASGYAVSSIDWTPKIVEVFTSGSVTGTLTTDTVDITGATGDITRTVSLSQPGNVITRPGNVPVTVRVSNYPDRGALAVAAYRADFADWIGQTVCGGRPAVIRADHVSWHARPPDQNHSGSGPCDGRSGWIWSRGIHVARPGRTAGRITGRSLIRSQCAHHHHGACGDTNAGSGIVDCSHADALSVPERDDLVA